MRAAKQDLTVADIDAVLALSAAAPSPEPVYVEIARIGAATCGYRMLTVLQYDDAAGVVVRRYSSDPAYPVGGTKPLADFKVNHAAMAAGDGIFLAATRAEVARVYADHERLAAIGVTAILNAQIRHAGHRLGTLNFTGSEGQYGAREIAIARVLAGLLVPWLAGAHSH